MTRPERCATAWPSPASRSLPRPPAQETVIDYRISERDTLIGLSETVVFTGPQAWREIARLNRLPMQT